MKTKSEFPKMNIVMVGHVDHGKSTLIGRLLADTGSLPKGKLNQVKKECERNAKPFEYAFLLDALKDEQAQGITIDAARCFFKSKKREYIIIDAPGHIEFLKNMVSGAARADAALLVIDAKEGIQENSKRHGYLLSMLGIRQVAVCVNKMDLVGYKQSVFQKIEAEYRSFLKQVGLEPKIFIPIAAREGVNITRPSSKMKWVKHKASILSVLDSFEMTPSEEQKPFRMPVQSVYKFTEAGDERRIIAGKIESGTIAVGDKIIFLPSNKRSEIKSIEEFPARQRKQRSAGFSTGFTLKEQIYVHRGDVLCKAGEPLPFVSSLVQVELFWMGREPMVVGKEYTLKICTYRTPVVLKQIRRVIDASDLKKVNKKSIERHDVAECVLECFRPIVFDLSHVVQATGRFVIVDGYDIAGGGIIMGHVQDEQAHIREQVTRREERWEASLVDAKEREAAYGHQPRLILLTGRFGVDKKSIAKELERILFQNGKKAYFLGIGNLLRGLDSDIETDRVFRKEHVRRLGEVSNILVDAGLLVLATASDLTDDELRMLQELTRRDLMLIVNVGKSGFRDGIVDLNLDVSDNPKKNAKKIFGLLSEKNILVFSKNS